MPEPETNEILWYRPDPRAIIPLDHFHVSRSLKKSMRKRGYKVTFSKAFKQVMEECASRPETWINQDFLEVYQKMHQLGLAHSVEVWLGDRLVGGTYGVCLCGSFFAESKFHKETDASKVALYFLVERLKQQNFKLLECQFLTPHLQSLGAIGISDSEYQEKLTEALKIESEFLGDLD